MCLVDHEHPEHGQEENIRLGASSGRLAANEPAYLTICIAMLRLVTFQQTPKEARRTQGTGPTLLKPTAPRSRARRLPMPYEDDSEETEEDGGNNIEDGWRYSNNADDEETPDED
ncbi:hypothetical protein U9M48_041475 [Paspalum notatum var. saurae]|uniref:Uncharacterized protein n=1 Tax=Paspalum notatum var. saurae TaxID=547442 RepID=A0AAQ3XDD1_PASNO